MTMKLATATIAAIVTASAMAGTSAAAIQAPSDAETSPTRGVTAIFEGTEFQMGDGWGDPGRRPEIGACHVDLDNVTCYRTEAEMDAKLGASARGVQQRASCSSSLRLYDGTNKTGAVIYLTTRNTLLNLSVYGFSNRTSSYRVGACSSTFYDGFGSGLYPGSTGAWASANYMLSGWNNRISSVLIN